MQEKRLNYLATVTSSIFRGLKLPVATVTLVVAALFSEAVLLQVLQLQIPPNSLISSQTKNWMIET